jgi:hypothetical protein
MTIIQHRSFVVLKLPLPVPQLLKVAQAIIAALTNNALLPSPNPPLAALTAAVQKLDAAETATKTRAPGTVALRNLARVALLADLHTLKAYVQQVADANPDNAEAIITSAGMTVRKAPLRTKAQFAAKAGPISGTVHLVARAAAVRSAYEWEWSSDGGKTWTGVAATLQAKTTITGLPANTSCQFRYKAVTKTGEGDWSLPVVLLVK